MSKLGIPVSKRVGMLFYLATKPRSFDELLFFTKASKGALRNLVDFGLRNNILIVSKGKYSVCANLSDSAKNSFKNHKIQIIPEPSSNVCVYRNNSSGRISPAKRARNASKSKIRTSRIKNLSTHETQIYSGGLDMLDEAIALDYSRNTEFGHGRRKSLEWNDRIAREGIGKAKLAELKKKDPNSFDRFAMK